MDRFARQLISCIWTSPFIQARSTAERPRAMKIPPHFLAVVAFVPILSHI